MAILDGKAALLKQLARQRDGTIKDLAGQERLLRAHAERMTDTEKKQAAIKTADKMSVRAAELREKYDGLIAEKSQ